MGENTCKYLTVKGLNLEYIRYSYHSMIKLQIKNGQKIWKDISAKKPYK